METLGVFIVTVGAWLIYSGVISVDPLKTAQAIMADPANAATIIDAAKGAVADSGQMQLDAPNTVAPPGDPPSKAASNSPADLQAYALSLLGNYGWNSSEMAPLILLWNRESSWNYTATNPTSGAYGVPQALPGAKMVTAGLDWKTNGATQIKWGLAYIKGRYGSPTKAWEHEQSKGWY